MEHNALTRQLVAFLSKYEPFHSISEQDLFEAASRLTIRYFNANEFIFKQDQDTLDQFFIIFKGEVEIFDHNSLIDKVEVGDIFGVRPLLTNGQYLASAWTKTDGILYGIPIDWGLSMMRKHSDFSTYFISNLAAGQAFHRKERKLLGLESLPSAINDIFVLPKGNAVYSILPEKPIQEAVQRLIEKNIGSLLIGTSDNYIGLITRIEILRAVAQNQLHSPVSLWMRTPLPSCNNGLSFQEYGILMAEMNTRHLIVTEDGTPQSEIVGVLSEHDLMRFSGGSFRSTLKSLNTSNSITELVLNHSIAMDHFKAYVLKDPSQNLLRNWSRALMDTLLKRAFFLCNEQRIDLSRFCWLALGSWGREEQWLMTDQDHFIICEDETIKDDLKRIAEKVVDVLEMCGYEKDNYGLLPSHDEYICDLTTWRKRFEYWLSVPDPENILKASIFLDFRPILGNEQLSRHLSNCILSESSRSALFMRQLALNSSTLAPPLTFFGNFVVERSGEHKSEFDLKKRALLALIDMARILSLRAGLSGINYTPDRFDELALIYPTHNSLFLDASKAMKWVLTLRAIQGWRLNSDGRYIPIDEISKLDRQMLRNVFQVIHDLQKHIIHEFDLEASI